jgi:hypothetical protein
VASWRGEIQIPAPQVHRLRAVLPLVLHRARALQVADGTLLDPWNGDMPLDLHVVDGVHPLVGARYEGTHRTVVDDDGDDTFHTGDDDLPDGGTSGDDWMPEVEHRWAAAIEADDAAAVRVAVVDGVGTDDAISVTIEVPSPDAATEVRLLGLVPVSPDGYMAGDIQAEGTVSWGALGASGDREVRVATITLGHPRFRAGLVADVQPVGDQWVVTSEGFVSGRGLSRPLFGLMMFFVAKKMRPVLDRRFAELADIVAEWNDLCREHPDDADLADVLVDRWLDHFRRAGERA